MPDKKLPAVPETILKRRKRQAENRANRAKAAIAEKQERRKKRVDIFKRAEKATILNDIDFLHSPHKF